ncbi:ABC transporter ATP-binding protein [Deferrisoma camini]|uniref:ABC transporter ATP-binding protein n=1 Tax=Deferrisoma camini TaxID=1035120 RepID=UPI00046D6CCC|nr:ATP-binding cassette domain-containing protein [Deferrisoma camini]
MIQAENLTKYYGDVRALDGVSFHVERGEIVGLLGPNGAGKTTAMKILTCFMPPTSGTARVAGHDIFEQPLQVKRNVGYLPEEPPVYPELTVQEYLSYAGRLKGLGGANLKRAMGLAMEKCGVDHVARRLIGNLSKGYRQRVGLAQALLHNPPVLILDEPTVGLDPVQILEIRALIKDLAQEHTVILSTHIMQEVEAVCGRVIIINEGRIVAVDTADNLRTQMGTSRRILMRVARPGQDLVQKLMALDGVLDVEAEDDGRVRIESQLDRDVREDVARVAVESGAGLLELTGVAVSLEEVFLKLTTEDVPAALADEAAPSAAEGTA